MKWKKWDVIDAIVITVLWLAIALLALPSFARAQCGSGGCSPGVQRLPAHGPMPQFTLAPTLTPANEPGPMYGPDLHDEDSMRAKGYTGGVDPKTGLARWTRPVNTDGTPITTLACSDGSCGIGARRAAKTADWNAAPRGDRPPLATTPPSSPPASPTKPSEPPPVTSQPLDLDKLANILVDKLATDARFKGPKGEAGAPGRDGVDGKHGPAGPAGRDGADADETKIVAAVLAKLDYDAIAARVKVPTPTFPVTNPGQHYVLVADQSAGYWPRLSGELYRAQEYYSSIDVVPDPGNVGQMPQLVLYEGSTPLKVFKGQHEVSAQLAALVRN